jgi:hypothetical protein
MSERKVIAAEVVTTHPTPRPEDYIAVRHTMTTTATTHGYNDITHLHHTDTDPWPTGTGTHRHRFEAIAQHTART